jgi:predicted amidophosphoribosyltransferase
MLTLHGMCVHCGVPLLTPGTKWCKQCTQDARNNRGVCRYCHRDLTEFQACWNIQRAMTRAHARAAFPDWHCPSCLRFNEEVRELEIVKLEVTDNRRILVMICPECQSTMTTSYELFRPPPRDGSLGGGVSNDGS